jgi:hypothetical protein
MYIYGIIAIDAPDKDGETFRIDGCDIDSVHDALIRWDLTRDWDLKDVVGMVSEAVLVLDEHQVEHSDEWKVYEAAGKKPCVMVRGTIHDQRVIDALRGNVPVYFAVEGVLLERGEPGVLLKTRLTGLGLTLRPSHMAYRVHFYR